MKSIIQIMILTFLAFGHAQEITDHQGNFKNLSEDHIHLTQALFENGRATLKSFIKNYRNSSEEEKKIIKKSIYTILDLSNYKTIPLTDKDGNTLVLATGKKSYLYNVILLEDHSHKYKNARVEDLVFNKKFMKQYIQGNISLVTVPYGNPVLSSSYRIFKEELELRKKEQIKEKELTQERLNQEELQLCELQTTSDTLPVIIKNNIEETEVKKELNNYKVYMGYGLKYGTKNFSLDHDESASYFYLEAGGILWKGISPIIGGQFEIGLNPLKAGSQAHGTFEFKPLLGIAYSNGDKLYSLAYQPQLYPKNEQGGIKLDNHQLKASAIIKTIKRDYGAMSIKIELNTNLNGKITSCGIGAMMRFKNKYHN